MHLIRQLGKSLFVVALLLAPLSSFAGVFVSIGIEPPPLPVYEQPPCPDDGFIWTPGYWAYGDYGYYWVPGTWVQPPQVGVLWTPGYWGWGDGGYSFHGGYWGDHVGFYGGINYGFGYGGDGYGGGRWDQGRFFYNTAVNRVNVTNIHNTYVDNRVVNNSRGGASFNGGTNGVQAQPSARDRQFESERHIQPTANQQAHVHAASMDRGQLASANGGKPTTLAAPRVDAYESVAMQHAHTQPLTKQEKLNAAKTSGGHETMSQATNVHPTETPKTTTGGSQLHSDATHTMEHKEKHTSEVKPHTSTPKPHLSEEKTHTSAQPHSSGQSQPKAQGKPDDKKKDKH